MKNKLNLSNEKKTVDNISNVIVVNNITYCKRSYSFSFSLWIKVLLKKNKTNLSCIYTA